VQRPAVALRDLPQGSAILGKFAGQREKEDKKEEASHGGVTTFGGKTASDNGRMDERAAWAD